MVTGTDLDSRLRSAVEGLPRGLRDHILRVEVEADRLAERHGVDRERARLSALGHDLVRHLKGQALLDLAARYGLTPDPVEVASPVLVHGPVAARILSLDYGVEDTEMLDAVDCHTTARAGMATLEQVLFIADKIEPGKLSRRAELQAVYDAASEDLNAAVLRYLDLYLEEALRRRWQVHHRIEARNDLLERSRRSSAASSCLVRCSTVAVCFGLLLLSGLLGGRLGDGHTARTAVPRQCP
jgi:predicted HD superfamily hydrolase involved in NAD metabolism